MGSASIEIACDSFEVDDEFEDALEYVDEETVLEVGIRKASKSSSDISEKDEVDDENELGDFFMRLGDFDILPCEGKELKLVDKYGEVLKGCPS